MLNTDRLQLQTNYLRQLHPLTREMMKSAHAVTIYILAEVCWRVSPCNVGSALEEQQGQILTSIPVSLTASWREADIYFSHQSKVLV